MRNLTPSRPHRRAAVVPRLDGSGRDLGSAFGVLVSQLLLTRRAYALKEFCRSPNRLTLHKPKLDCQQRFRHAPRRSDGPPPTLLPNMPRVNGAKVAAFMQTSLIALAPLICMFPSVCGTRPAPYCKSVSLTSSSPVPLGFDINTLSR